MGTRKKRPGIYVAVSTNWLLGRLATEGSSEAVHLWLAGLLVARSQQGAGIVSPRAVARVSGVSVEHADDLLMLGCWHGPGHDCVRCPQPPANHVAIHDYADWQDTPDEIEARIEQGRGAARKRWASGEHAESNANSMPRASDEQSSTHTEEELEEEVLPSVVPARKRATKTPESFDLSADRLRWAREDLGITNRVWLTSETDRWLDWTRQHDKRYKSWEAAWRNWIRKAIQIRQGAEQPSSEPTGEEIERGVREWSRLHPFRPPEDLVALMSDDPAEYRRRTKPLLEAHLEAGRAEVLRSLMRVVQ